jgi:ABC-type nickel/cobalt efflux system permease component RcnA
MASFWSLLNERALSVSVAQGAFNFEISWFGILLIVGAMLLWRYLRRR